MTSSSSAAGLVFDAVAGEYAACRPGYPAALFDALEDLSRRRLARADVLDVGAGTGIATRLLHERGARVTALEPGAGMAARLQAGLPDVPLVRGDGNALPFADASFDLVTYAQSWHWTEPDRSVPEALRALRPGGALALWWNLPDRDHAWVAEQEARLDERCPHYRDPAFPGAVAELLAPCGLTTRESRVTWSRRISVDQRIRTLASHSPFLRMGADAEPVLRAERAELLALFPEGMLDEPYVTELTVTIRPPDPSPSRGPG